VNKAKKEYNQRVLVMFNLEHLKPISDILNDHGMSFHKFYKKSDNSKLKFMAKQLSNREYTKFFAHYQKLVDKGLIAW